MDSTTYIAKLNSLLSSYQMHYQNLRSLHWNIKGKDFFELHMKYEEMYNRAQVIIDELAERILTLGGTPLSRFSDYLISGKIDENPIIEDGTTGVQYIFTAQGQLLELEKDLLKYSESEDDEGTNSLMSDLIREKEKTNWMLRSWLKR